MKATRRAVLAIVALAAAAVSGCASSQKSAPTEPEPEIVASTRGEGHGYPYGASTASPFTHLTKKASSATYGYSQTDPIRVGVGVGVGVGGEIDDGPRNSQLYLNALRGPNGEVIQYERRGSCCHFETKSSELGIGLLDVYELTYPGLATPIVLYVNMYDPGEPLIPQGLTARDE